MFKDIYVESKNIVLKPFSMKDIKDLYTLFSDEKVMKYIPDGIYSYERVVDLVNWMVCHCYEENTQDNIEKFGVSVMLKASSKVIGWCGLGSLDCAPSDIELFYGLSSDHWGKGFATEAANAMLYYGFNIIGLSRIVAVVNPSNLASKRVIEKIGMTYEKTIEELRPELSGYNGEFYYAISKNDYNFRT